MQLSARLLLNHAENGGKGIVEPAKIEMHDGRRNRRSRNSAREIGDGREERFAGVL